MFSTTDCILSTVNISIAHLWDESTRTQWKFHFDRWNEPSNSDAGSDAVLESYCFTDKTSLNFDSSMNHWTNNGISFKIKKELIYFWNKTIQTIQIEKKCDFLLFKKRTKVFIDWNWAAAIFNIFPKKIKSPV